MIDRSDSPATTQTNTSCLNSIPSRLVRWLYGKLASIAETVKRIFSRGSMGQSESLPETRPLAERTSSEVKAERTFLHTPDPQVTTPSQEVELDNAANRPLPVLNGGEVICLSRDLKPILDGMKEIFEELKTTNSTELSEAEKRAGELEKCVKGEQFDDSVLSDWAFELFSMYKMDHTQEMSENNKNNFLRAYNDARMAEYAGCAARADTFIQNINGVTSPLVDELISSLTNKYSDSCTDRASEEDIKVLQDRVGNIQFILHEGTKGLIRQQIAFDAKLEETYSDIRGKLQTITQTLQM